ncbi:MAG: hypothetical protein AAGL96_13975 [Pseudomonadota bacterium]
MRFLGLMVMLAACNTAHPYFRDAPVTTLTIEGSTFDIRVRENLAEAIRTNPQYAPCLGPIRDRAQRGIERVSGCAVKEMRGDQAQLTGILDCGNGGPRIDRLKPQGEYDCHVIDSYVSRATNQVFQELDCTLI